jgi:hypothetical protein
MEHSYFVGVERSGKIVFSRRQKDILHTLQVASCAPENEARLQEIIEVNARHGYDGDLLCPGVPEAASSDQAVDSVVWFQALIDMRMRGESGWPPRDPQTFEIKPFTAPETTTTH